MTRTVSKVRLLLAALVAAVSFAAATLLSGPPAPPNIVVVVMDAFRADRLGATRDGVELTPNLSRFAAGGVVFENAWCAGPQTKLSVASIFTGRLPSCTGVITFDNTIPAECTTLAERMKERGYRTIGVSANAWIVGEHDADAACGFQQGFDVWRFLHGPAEELQFYAPAPRVNEFLLTRLGPSELPTFLYVHYMDTHGPYLWDRPRETTGLFAGGDLTRQQQYRADRELRNRYLQAPDKLSEADARRQRRLYDEAIVEMDRRVGELVEALRAKLGPNTIFIFTADHGEELGECGEWGHGGTPRPGDARVPLVVAGRGIPRRTVRTHVSNVRLYDWIGALADRRTDELLDPPAQAIICQMRTEEEDVVKRIDPHGTAVTVWLDADGKLLRAERRDVDDASGESEPLPVSDDAARAAAAVPRDLRRLARRDGITWTGTDHLWQCECAVHRPGEPQSPERARAPDEEDARMLEHIRALGYLH